MSLPVRLTEHEVLKISRECGEVNDCIEGEEEAAKEDARLHRDTVKELKLELSGKLKTLRIGSMLRPVEVYEVSDYAAGEVRTYRVDTDELVLKRTMREDERQQDLPLETPEESTPEESTPVEEPAAQAKPLALGAEDLDNDPNVIRVDECIDVTPRAIAQEELPEELPEATPPPKRKHRKKS